MNDLESLAFEYGLACSMKDSALICRAPDSVLVCACAAVLDTRKNLLDAAVDHFERTYDGAEA